MRCRIRCFNSRTPCGVRLEGHTSVSVRSKFQFTHPVWGATTAYIRLGVTNEFQFTHPVWGATSLRSACAGRKEWFQFTHPVWGATKACVIDEETHGVSIHAPRVGCDPRTTSVRCHDGCFNSRTPCGVRHWLVLWIVNSKCVSIHAPRVGCD